MFKAWHFPISLWVHAVASPALGGTILQFSMEGREYVGGGSRISLVVEMLLRRALWGHLSAPGASHTLLLLLWGLVPVPGGNGWWIEPISCSASTAACSPSSAQSEFPTSLCPTSARSGGLLEEPFWFNHMHSTQCCCNRGSPATC